MGILRESAEEDIADITWVAKWSASAWNHYAKTTSNSDHADLHVEVNENIIPGLSDVGAKVLNKHIPDPDLVLRIATLVAVATCCPPFSLRRKGKLIGMEQRR